jgi:hypothetical protein
MRVSWILMPGYFAVPTAGLESGKAVGRREQLFTHFGEMVQPLLQSEIGAPAIRNNSALRSNAGSLPARW